MAVSNTLLTPSNLLREAIRRFSNNITAIKNSKILTRKEFEIGGRRTGTSISVAVPNLATVRTGATFSGQAILENSVTVNVDQQWGIDITGLTSLEMSMKLENFSEQILKPYMDVLAARVESDFLAWIYKRTFNLVGTAGTTPQSLLVYLQAQQKITEAAAPFTDRSIHISPPANTLTVDALKGLFQPSGNLAAQYMKGSMGNLPAAGAEFYINQSMPAITTGSCTRSGGPVLTSQPANGATTLAVGTLGANNTVQEGDVFTIAGINKVNPLTKVNTNILQQFVCRDSGGNTANASGAIAALTVSPALYYTGPLQNISAQPAGTEALTFVGNASTTYTQDLTWYKDAVCWVSVEVEKPRDVHFAESMTIDGISMRVVQQFDINGDKYPLRFDVYGGFGVLRPEWITRLTE